MKSLFLSMLICASVSLFSQSGNPKPKKVETSYSKEIKFTTEIKKLNRESALYLQFAETAGLLNDELLVLDDLKIYPNPNHGFFTVEFKEKTNGLIHVFVYNSKNEVYFEDQAQVDNEVYSVSVDLGKAPAGVYFLLLKRDASSVAHKIEKL